MADFVNQAVLQQLHSRTKTDPQQLLLEKARLNLQQQQAKAAQQQQAMNRGVTALSLDWVPVEEKVRIANELGKQFGLQGAVTADGIQPYRQLLTDMQKDMEQGKDLSRWSTAVDLFSANPAFVDPSQRGMVLDAGRQLQEQKVQQVATAQVPSVEGGPLAMSRTQQARGRLELFRSIKPDDPEAPQKLEAYTRMYGSVEKMQQQMYADELVVADEETRLKERERYASALRMAPAELAKQASSLLDPKTMLLPMIARAIQEKGLDGLSEQDRNRVDAHYVLNGQPEKLGALSEGAKVNELKRYQQDLLDTRTQLGAIEQVQKAMTAGKERVGTYEAAASEALSLIAKRGAKMPTEQYEQRQAALAQLSEATTAIQQDWDDTTEPIRAELTKGAQSALATVQDLTKQMSRPGVDRVTLAKRRDVYQQMADTYEQMNSTMGLTSAVDVALQRQSIAALELDAQTGETAEARASAAASIPRQKERLAELERRAAKNDATIDASRERLSRYAKLTQARLTVGDRKLEQAQQNGQLASMFLGDWVASGFKLSPDTWYTGNARLVEGADPKLFMDVVKPALDSRKDIQQGRAEQELLRSGDAKQAGPIAAKYGVKPSDILGVLKDPNRPLADVKIYNEKQTVDQAGKLANINQAISEIKSVRQVFVNPDGTINRAQLLAGTLGVPFTAGKGAEQLIERSIEIKLRAATGAAARPDELKLYGRLFGPSTIDSDEMIRYKLDSLENWMGAVADTTDPTGDLRKRAESMMAKGTIQQLTTPEYAELRKKFPQASSQDIIRFLQSRKAQP